ncbi:hypothetical protein NDU88_000944 [Pleurodeles waltl]|uniref:Integrase p58-like C-terminal domain-containing protein n=1 Tax=Pleurodeles waltl TaxID=8319 RepID=A0AAV7URG0_PLEWA|nr:hypothetical protein NDU88_000944 [Pleurodeles waltl]
MAEYMEKASKNLEASQQLQKFWYDQKAAMVEFQPGQKVWVLEPVAPRALQDRWSGPYPVLKKKSQVTYLVDLGTSRTPKRVIHVNRLKLFHDRADVNLLMVTDEDQEAESEPLPDLLSTDPKDGSVDGVIYSDTLSGQQQPDCRKVLQQFAELFSLTPGQTHLCTHDVDTGDSMPVKNNIFRQSDQVKESIKVEVHKMLELGVIEHSDSPCASPVVLVPKPHTKDGKSEMRGPLALVKEGWERPLHEPKQDIVDYVLGLRSRMAEYMEKASKNLEASQQLQKFWYDQKAAMVEFQPGQKVWVLEPVAPRALQDRWSGPYPVLKKKSQVTYLVDLGTSRTPKRVIHVNRLKLFHDRADVNLLMVTDEDQEAESEPLPDLLSTDPKDGSVDGVIYSDTLSGQQQPDCRKVLQQFAELFSLTPGQTHLCTHDVDTGDSMPVKNNIFRQSDQVKESIKVEVHKMLELGVIEHSDSPCASPVVLVPKPHTKDGKREMRNIMSNAEERVMELDLTPYLHLRMRELRSLCKLKNIKAGINPSIIQLQELLAEFAKANPSEDDLPEDEASDLEENSPPPVLIREIRAPQALSPTVLVKDAVSLTGGSSTSVITEDSLSEDDLLLARMAKRLALERQLLAIERERRDGF